MPGFVSVSDGCRFQADGKPFCFAGANSYYLMVCLCVSGLLRKEVWVIISALQTRAAEEGCRHEVTEILDSAVKAGLTAIRLGALGAAEQASTLVGTH